MISSLGAFRLSSCLNDVSHAIGEVSHGGTSSEMEDLKLSSNDKPTFSAQALTRKEKGTDIDGRAE